MMSKSNRVRVASRVLALALLLMTIGCDRVTKHLATAHLADTPVRSYFGDTLRLEYAENPGAFLSVGSRLPEWARIGLFRIGVGMALTVVAFVALKHRWIGMPLIGASLVFAGGLSNLGDRLVRGSVVDFVSVGIGPLRTGIFNVADVAVLLGGALIAIGISGIATPE
jgi:signal peptidase II